MTLHSSSWRFAKKHMITLSCATALSFFAATTVSSVSADEVNTTNTPASTQVEATVPVTSTSESTVIAADNTAQAEASDSTSPAESATTTPRGITQNEDGSYSYYDATTGEKVTQAQFLTLPASSQSPAYTIYIGTDGNLVNGLNQIEGDLYYFDNYRLTINSPFTLEGQNYVSDIHGHVTEVPKNDYYTVNGNWYYFDKDGHAVTGAQTIDDFDLYFHQDGQQAKGEIVTLDGKAYYYDQDNGCKVTNTSLDIDGKTYVADNQGVLAEKTAEATTITGGHFQADDQGNWYYYTAQGDKLTGFQNVDDVDLYFDADGKQAKGGPKTIDGKVYYFDEHSGVLKTNQWVSWKVGYGERWATFIGTVHGYLTADGRLATGWQTIDGQDYYFNEKGQRIENNIETIDGKRYLFNDQGQLVKNGSFTIARDSWVGTLKFTYTTDENDVVIAENN